MQKSILLFVTSLQTAMLLHLCNNEAFQRILISSRRQHRCLGLCTLYLDQNQEPLPIHLHLVSLFVARRGIRDLSVHHSYCKLPQFYHPSFFPVLLYHYLLSSRKKASPIHYHIQMRRGKEEFCNLHIHICLHHSCSCTGMSTQVL